MRRAARTATSTKPPGSPGSTDVLFVFPDQRFGRPDLAVVQAVILRAFNRRPKAAFRLPVGVMLVHVEQDYSREKKKKRNLFSRKIVGLKDHPSGD